MRQTGTRFKHEKTDLIAQYIAYHYNIMQLLLYFKDGIMLNLEIMDLFFFKNNMLFIKVYSAQLYRPHSAHSTVKEVWFCLDMHLYKLSKYPPFRWPAVMFRLSLQVMDRITSLSLLLFPIVYSSPGHQTLNLASHRAESFSGTHTVSYSYLLI